MNIYIYVICIHTHIYIYTYMHIYIYIYYIILYYLILVWYIYVQQVTGIIPVDGPWLKSPWIPHLHAKQSSATQQKAICRATRKHLRQLDKRPPSTGKEHVEIIRQNADESKPTNCTVFGGMNIHQSQLFGGDTQKLPHKSPAAA